MRSVVRNVVSSEATEGWRQAALASLKVERLKLRGSTAVLVSLVLPIALVLAILLFVWFDGERFFTGGGSPARWLGHTVLSTWTFVFLPIHLALVSSFVASQERAAGGWTLQFIQPTPRTAVYTGKCLAVYGLLALALATLGLATISSSWLLELAKSDLGFATRDLVVPLGRHLLTACLASALAVAVQTWVAFRSTDLVAPMLAGVGGFLGLPILRSFQPDWLAYWPWSYPNTAAIGWLAKGGGEASWLAAGVGCVVGALLVAACAVTFTRRDLVDE